MPAVVVGVFGLLIGSFLNVVIYRVPLGLSIVSPPSACGTCETRILARDNVPLLSWILLRGKCRACSAPISIRYPLVELAGAVAFFAVGLQFLSPVLEAATVPLAIGSSLVLIAFLFLAAISIALALIDLDTHTLPNVIVLPAFVVGVVLLGAAAVLRADGGSAVRALVGAVVLGLIYLALSLKGGMGLGDVKLAGVLGLFLGWLGWDILIVGTLSAFLAGGAFGLILLIAQKAGRKSRIPFGPWMLGGAWVGILFGAPLASGYLALWGVAS